MAREADKMTPDQIAAARSLHRALKKCAETSLGVYVFDGTVSVCPQPDGRDDPRWSGAGGRDCGDSLIVIDDIGMSLYVDNLDCDGGAGR